MNLTRLHAVCGTLALLTILNFWLSTVLSQWFGTQAHVAAVKTGILYDIPLLVLFIAGAGAMDNKVRLALRTG